MVEWYCTIVCGVYVCLLTCLFLLSRITFISRAMVPRERLSLSKKTFARGSSFYHQRGFDIPKTQQSPHSSSPPANLSGWRLSNGIVAGYGGLGRRRRVHLVVLAPKIRKCPSIVRKDGPTQGRNTAWQVLVARIVRSMQKAQGLATGPPSSQISLAAL